ncbi:hypothetical protein [Paenibacillus sp. S150]|uniref:hypothetical protein n=1 Tax=Paenibacillus sp. S150 TaxID=2749826 RepID=UPI001C59E8F2|nr:hypothetical protein [Paenibacillus sp. S150]MBW4085813.1 hypothetical protein [Paenibacillus sp. S150]
MVQLKDLNSGAVMKLKRIISLVLLSAVVWISGCSGKDNIYAGIEKQDIKSIKTARELEYFYEYKGHTDNWASTYFV